MKIQTALLISAIENDLNPGEATHFFLIDRLIQKSFKFGKQNVHFLAEHYLQQAEKLLHTCPENSLLKEWCMSIYLPKKSYFLFKKNDFELARERIEENYAILRKLILKGHHFLIFVLIQQTHNMVRMLFFKQEKRKALLVIKKDLDFLISEKPDEGCLSGFSLRTFMHAHPAEAANIIVSFVNQLLNETLLALLKNEDQEETLQLLTVIFPERWNPEPSYLIAKEMEVTHAFMNVFSRLANNGDLVAFSNQAAEMRQSGSGFSNAQKSVLSQYVCLFTIERQLVAI